MSNCEQILRKAIALHVDECEAAYIKKKITTVRITDSEIAEIKQNNDQGIGVRLITEKKILSAFSTNIEEKDLVERALQTRYFLQPKSFWKSLPHYLQVSKIEKTYDRKLEEITGREAIEIANIMIDSALHQKIKRISGSLNIVSEDFEISNTNGVNYSDKATYIAGTINADSDHGNIPVSGIGAMSCRTRDSFSPNQVGIEAKEMCVNSINPQNCEPDTYSIIFEPYAIGEMLAFVFASNFNLKTYSEKRSCFTDRLGKKISIEQFSLTDNPHHPDGIGSKSFDDEGTPTKIRHLVKDGIFSNTYSDSFYAFKEDLESTGNASRMGTPMGRAADPIPVPTPHNLTIDSGEIGRDDMIKNTRKGLLVGRLWYTYSVNPERGDFSCTARSGVRIIENGKIVSAGKPFRIIHNLPMLLQNISGIGKDSRNVLQWSALPCVTPSIKVDRIKITAIQ
ncbi:MAG TPA: TldD/PmbA family protein [Candidatus Nitrosotalea sp.]|nr:TldD/PmbA family protein [Candidatus Nitrosotalea sp.]